MQKKLSKRARMRERERGREYGSRRQYTLSISTHCLPFSRSNVSQWHYGFWHRNSPAAIIPFGTWGIKIQAAIRIEHSRHSIYIYIYEWMCDLMHEWHSVWPTTMTIETAAIDAEAAKSTTQWVIIYRLAIRLSNDDDDCRLRATAYDNWAMNTLILPSNTLWAFHKNV